MQPRVISRPVIQLGRGKHRTYSDVSLAIDAPDRLVYLTMRNRDLIKGFRKTQLIFTADTLTNLINALVEIQKQMEK